MEEKEGIEDRTQTNLINLRRVIYLTIMNALNYEEAVHKLLKVQIKEGQEVDRAAIMEPLTKYPWSRDHLDEGRHCMSGRKLS